VLEPPVEARTGEPRSLPDLTTAIISDRYRNLSRRKTMRARTIVRGTLALAAASALSAPSVLAQSNPAQSHMGHVADGFRGTPEGQGLLPTAVAEIATAAQHAGFAAREPGNLESIQRHMAHVIHALDPSVVADGPGAGYGVKAAASGAANHIQMAGASEGASDNVKRHAPHVAAGAGNSAEWADEAVALAQEIEGVSDAETAVELLYELTDKLEAISAGTDGEGTSGWGLAQATQHMGLMKTGEGMDH